MRRSITLVLLTLALLNPLPAFSQEQLNADIQAKIRKEGSENSQIMRTMHFLTDVYGPRLTGSPNLKAAGEWAIRTMESWGLENGHLEPWNFGNVGWNSERLSAHVISPFKDHLTAEALAWTPGTRGILRAQAFHLITPDSPTAEQLAAYFDSVKSTVKGKIVFVGKQIIVPVTINPPARRIEDTVARQRFDPNNANAGGGFGPRGNRQQAQPEPGKLTARQVSEQVDAFLVANGAAMRIDDGGREHGQIRAFNNRTFDLAKVVTTVILRNEDFGRITRILADGTPVELEFEVVNAVYPEGKTAYNTIAEIPGSDKRDEVIMLGGHLDSWHAATGATDNAIGCAVMMEAARILKAIGVKPRRTIRVALWSGEEQGLLGSQAYVKEHFGSADNPKPEYFKFGGYFNIDSGTGRARGMSVFGPPAAAQILRETLAPFTDIGVMGALPSRSRALGGSDNTSFSQAGLPGIGVSQDPIEYNSATWHTNLDNYERIIEDDAKKSATAIAAAVYQLAMRDELLPRFSAADMPPLPPAGGTRPVTTPPATQAVPSRPPGR